MFFFVSILVFCIVVRNPIFQLGAFFVSSALLCILLGKYAIKRILSLFLIFILIAFLNPLFNTQGQTVLFTYFGGRPYTFEALQFGFSTAAMFVNIVILFMSYSLIITIEKFTYLFGRRMPAVTSVIVMVQRLLPLSLRRISTTSDARALIGKPVVAGSLRETALKERFSNAAAVLSSVATWAFSQAVTTADSMKSRGYGCADRTSYRNYPFSSSDAAMLAAIAIADAVAVACCIL